MKCINPKCAIFGLEDHRIVLAEHAMYGKFWAECTVCGWRGQAFRAKDRTAALAKLEGKT